MKTLLLTLFLTIVASTGHGTSKPATNDEAMTALLSAIADNDIYVNQRFAHIDSLKAIASNDAPSALLLGKIADEMRGIDVDSAIAYYSRGINLARNHNDSVTAQRLELKRASLLPIVGIVKESVAIIDSIEQGYIYPDNLRDFYSAASSLFYYISSFYQISELKANYVQRGLQYTDSLLQLLPPDTNSHRICQAQALLAKGDRAIAMALLDEILAEVDITENLFARAAVMRASIAESTGNEQEAIHYLTLSALADILSGTRETTSLQRLGLKLYNRGDVENAYTCLMLALDNAVQSGARIRAVESSQALPIIAQSFREQDRRKLTWLWVLIILLTIALTIICFVIVAQRRRKLHLESLRNTLSKSNYVKEIYISRFLSLCSIYMERLEEFNRLAGRKISAGQIEDLYRTIKSGKMLDEQRQLFFEIFDEAFVNIYPTFIADVNNLLSPDKKISIGDKKGMSTELRILAFMRLGVNDNNQISGFTGLSLNTIYTYRTKMKARAINRDTFEADIMKIGEIS